MHVALQSHAFLIGVRRYKVNSCIVKYGNVKVVTKGGLNTRFSRHAHIFDH